MNGRLPAPARTRWQPLRIGLVDLFYYDVEEFRFRDGRLLLRGNNGTGKSKVLALTLPFLLDGDLSAHRVEPDGDPKKRMEWNLLLGGEHPHPERLGYTWIEFGRRDEDGSEHFTTLGCGLKAVSGRGIARHWFFVTDRRIGADPADGGLSLLDGTRSAIGRDRLADALNGRGMVYDSARAYRRAVDETLFGLGEQRYGALVDLLVQLRQPQLSKRPSEKALSQALTEALPPMDQAVIADVAEAFRSLDEEKEQLAAMAEAERAAGTFLTHYRRYARTAARRRARLPRREHSRYESLRADLSAAELAHAAAGEAMAEAETLLEELAERRARLRASDEALRAGPEMRSAGELEQAAESAERTERDAARAEADRVRADDGLARTTARLGAAQSRFAAAERGRAAALERAAEAARAARLGAVHDERVAGPLTSTDAGESAEPQLRRAAGEAVERRDRSVRLVEGQLAGVGEAAEELDRARRRLEDADAEMVRRAELRAQAEDGVEVAGDAHADAVRDHLAGCVESRSADPQEVLEELRYWVGTLDGPDPARTAAQEAARRAGAKLARVQAELDASRGEAEERSAELRAELAELEAGGQRGPRPPHTRDPGAREGVPGAPLWRLVDFTADDGDPSNLTERQQAGVEAALEASGLLDAWVLPDGTALRPGTHDVLLTVCPPVHGPSLAEVLRPAVDQGDDRASAVPDSAVTALLAGVGLVPEAAGGGTEDGTGGGPVDCWVSPDGRFRIGALTGAWAKESAEYLGEGAREQARRTRIGTLHAELAALTATLADLEEQARTARAREQSLAAELAAFPDDSALRRAHAATAAAAAEYSRTEARRADREAEAARAAGTADTARAELEATAEELDLPADATGLRAVHEALSSYREALAALWPAVRELRSAASALEDERADRDRAAAHTGELAERARTATREAVSAKQRYETLAATVGTAVAELQRQLDGVRLGLRACDDEERAARRAHTAAAGEQGAAEALRDRVRTEIEEAVTTRAAAVEALRRFAATGLLAVALPDLEVSDPAEPWAPDPAVRLARAVERDLAEDTDDSDPVWERVQGRITEELKELADSLSRHGNTAAARMLEDGLVVDVVFQGRERTVPELAAALAEEVADRRRLLSEREQEILENHLITEVAGTLQELVGSAEQQVARMNAELSDRPTSTGMRLRLVWRPARNAPGGLATARDRLLRQTSDAWSAEDRSSLGEFLQAQIDRARADDPAGTWLEHLTAALDYRAWHEFGIERHQHGTWQSATGPASGGERVLSVSIPLFAAASSHYASARSPHAPRLVTLDEAFAGVDDDSRAKSLGLLAAFDLDVVMTSEREWGCYPQVPGLAVAQLSRVDEIAAVLVTRWEWDGLRRTRADALDELLPASVGADAVAAPRDALSS